MKFSYCEFSFLTKFFSPFSPLQIYGLIFFSRKRKNERRGNQPQIPLTPLKIHKIKVQILSLLLHHFPTRGLAMEPLLLFQLPQLIRTLVLLPVAIFSVLNLLALSSQQFLLPRLLSNHLVQTCLRDTKYALDYVINEKV